MTRRFLSIVLALCASLAAAAAIRTQVMPASYATGIGNEDAPILYVMMEVDDPADAEESALPFMRAVRDKFFELRSDVHEIIYILFVNDAEEYSYPVSVSVEDVP